MKINRRDFIKAGSIITGGLLTGCVGKTLSRTAKDKRPNIILINSDDLGYGDIGCFGSKLNRTPNIDKLAEEGVKFTDFYMPDSVCTPSRAGMLTGCYPSRISFDTFDGLSWNKARVLFPGDPVGLHPDEITFATMLKKEGYATSLVGKWHVGDQKGFLPTDHGFDHFFGLPFSNDMGRQLRKNRPMFPPLPLMRGEKVIQQQPDQASLTERYVSESLDFIRKNKDEDKPFLLYFSHMYVHSPIYAPKPYLDKSINGSYGAAVEHIDWSVAAITYELKQLGIDDNTLVIFTSDNGHSPKSKGSGGGLKGCKGTTYEAGQRLPCIMRWPKKIKPGMVSSEVCSAIDFLPTFADIAKCKTPQDRIIDGKSMLGLMTTENAKTLRESFFYYSRNRLDAVRSGKWKYWPEEQYLYDMEVDAGEKNNVYDKHPKVTKKLDALLEICREDIGDTKKGIVGKNRRPIGKVKNPKPLTKYNPKHPYIVAMYD